MGKMRYIKMGRITDALTLPSAVAYTRWLGQAARGDFATLFSTRARAALLYLPVR